MVSFARPESLQFLRDRLETVSPEFFDYEAEELRLYGSVAKRLKEAGIMK
jgi:hypothetical protein